MSTPFFSIVIPTFNRSNSLHLALKSALQQTFINFEIIISDNSNNELCIKKNLEIIKTYGYDYRINYTRPNNWLNMHDHWEYATSKAKGKFVLVLTDRFVMCPKTIEFIYWKIMTSDPSLDIISWGTLSFTEPGLINKNKNSGLTYLYDSISFLQEFISLQDWNKSFMWNSKLPRALNCCYSQRIANKIRKKHGRMFFSVAPDYTAGFLLLANSKKFLFCDVSPYISHGSASNGKECLILGINKFTDNLDLSGRKHLLKLLPSRLSTVTNFLLVDFLVIQEMEIEAIGKIRFDIKNLMLSNYRELMQMEKLGTQVNLGQHYKLWKEDVALLPNNLQIEIDGLLLKIIKQRSKLRILRRLIVRYQLMKGIYIIKSFIIKMYRYAFNLKTYKSVMDASFDCDQILKITSKHE
jgi:glycosyltransferase involved in cell wall biosynthesis